MDDMKSQLNAIDTSITGIYLLLKEIPLNINALGEKITTNSREIFLQFDPRISRAEEKIEELEDDRNKK